MEALKPKLFIPTHHDNWAPPVTTAAINYKGYIEEEMGRIEEEERPELLFIEDPKDYVNPET